MKKSIALITFVLIIFFASLMTAGFLKASESESVIYIAESKGKNWNEEITLITKVRPDGTELRKIYVNGIKTKISPDGKKIIYLENKGSQDEPIWEIALADENGKKINNLPTFLNEYDEDMKDTAMLAWSPNGTKIAFLQYSKGVEIARKGKRRRIILNVIDLNKTELECVYTSYIESMEEAYAYIIEWHPDNKRILVSGTSGTELGTELIDVKLKTIQTISNDFIIAHLTDDGRRIIYLSGMPFSQIWQYDTEKQRKEKLFSLDSPSGTFAKFVLSHDDRFLALQFLPLQFLDVQPPLPFKEIPPLYIADLLSKKLERWIQREHS